jgi:hypothetical protein
LTEFAKVATFSNIGTKWPFRDKTPAAAKIAAPEVDDPILLEDETPGDGGEELGTAKREQALSPARGAMPDPTKFSEKEFRSEIVDLVSSRSTAKAGRVLVDNLSKLAAARFNIKEKLSNLLFLTRIVQDGGGAKYGHTKLRSKIRSVTGFLRPFDLPEGGFVELGCGAHDPIAMSTFFYLNGFVPSCGVDLLPPRVEQYSAMSMYDILANMKMFPDRYVWRGGDPRELAERIGTIDVAKFEGGDFRGGLASMNGGVRLIDEDLLICDLQPGSIALLTSFAVLEHVTDLAGIFARCFELLAPGGITYHFIDLADHRSYRGDDTFSAFSFLTETIAPANMNRVRAPQFTQAALDAGFELLVDRRIVAEMSPEDMENLVAPFSSMPLDDVATTKQHLVLRKPV